MNREPGELGTWRIGNCAGGLFLFPVGAAGAEYQPDRNFAEWQHFAEPVYQESLIAGIETSNVIDEAHYRRRGGCHL